MARIVIEDLTDKQAKLLSEQLSYMIEHFDGIFETIEMPILSLPAFRQMIYGKEYTLHCSNGEHNT